jgi:hypothetical protein
MFIWINELQPARLSVPGDKAGLAGAALLLSIFAAKLPAAKAAGSIPFQRVVWITAPFRLGLRFAYQQGQ